MKKERLLKTVCSALCLIGGMMLSPFEAKADTSLLSQSAGWTKITSLPSTLTDYYFVFVDHSQDLMLSYGEGTNQSVDAAYKTMVYRTSDDPAMNPAMLWTLEGNNTGYSIKSAVETDYFMQTENNAPWYCRTHDNGGGDASWYKWIFNYADGSWTIQNGKYPDNGYIGGWDVTPKNGLNVAANNTASEKIGHFQIYTILKTAVDWMANASESRPANLSYKIANSYAGYNGTTGWTGSGSNTRNGSTGFDGIAGFFEFCNWEAESWSGSLSQTITGLPAGTYRVRVAGQLHDSDTGMTLDVNGSTETFPANGTSNGTILASGIETTAGSGVAGWRYVSTEVTLASGQSLVITLSSSASAQYRWANFDNVELYCIGIDDDPYAGWEDASMANPLDWTTLIITNSECGASDEGWSGSGRTHATGTYYDGTSRSYFTQNHENGAARSQAVTLPKPGCYLLRTIVRPVYAASYATISVGSESTTTRGIQTGTANLGNGWAYNDIYFATTSANESKTISIALSNVNSSREADCGEMHLYYIGQYADFVKEGVHKYIGTFATAPALTLTDAEPVADIKDATFSGTSSVTFTNPNGLVFANSGQATASKNLVVNGTCASLQLSDGHPFLNPTQFTATSASYTLSALAGNRFATLMLPYDATAPSGSVYTLNNGVDLIAGTLKGTVASSIAANSPVLVTTSGDYTGSNVTVPVVAQGATYTNDELVGTYTAMTAVEHSYVLQNHTSGEGVAFYLVGSTKPTVNPFRAYIKPQASNVKSISVLFDDTNTIDEIVNQSSNGKWYNLAGQQMVNGQFFKREASQGAERPKGVFIQNGKKFIVK